MKKRDPKKQARLEKITTKRAKYEKARLKKTKLERARRVDQKDKQI